MNKSKKQLGMDAAVAIRQLAKEGVAKNEIAREFGVHVVTVRRIIAGSSWSRIGIPWEDRFWNHVRVGEDHECWEWTSFRDDAGYGRFNHSRGGEKAVPRLAHRVSMSLFLGRDLEDGECVLHDCPEGDNPSCVNPKHLWIGTREDNNKDMMRKGRFRHHGMKGVQCYQSKLTEDDVRKVREIYASGDSTVAFLARVYGVHHSTIQGIIRGKSWRHVR